jgi:uncharacterized protein
MTPNPSIAIVRAAFVAAIVALAAVASGCSKSDGPLPTGTVTIRAPGGPVKLNVEIADDHKARVKGLMGRRSLNYDAGMAFLWDEPTDGSFWMKDTLIPLSIAFWAHGRVIALFEMSPCHQDPCRRYGPGKAYDGAVEATQGFFSNNQVVVGDQIELDR